MKEYTKYLVKRGFYLKLVQQFFDNFRKTSWKEAQEKVNPRDAKNLIALSTSSSYHGPNVNKIINKNTDLVFKTLI